MSTLALGAVATDLLLNRSTIEVSRPLFCFVYLWNRHCSTQQSTYHVWYCYCLLLLLPLLGAYPRLRVVLLAHSFRVRTYVFILLYVLGLNPPLEIGKTVRLEAAISETQRIHVASHLAIGCSKSMMHLLINLNTAGAVLILLLQINTKYFEVYKYARASYWSARTYNMCVCTSYWSARICNIGVCTSHQAVLSSHPSTSSLPRGRADSPCYVQIRQALRSQNYNIRQEILNTTTVPVYMYVLRTIRIRTMIRIYRECVDNAMQCRHRHNIRTPATQEH